jgi:microcystin-dependent protein
MSDPFLGQITLFPYSFAPQGWIECQGQILPISQYAALFSLLGTQFGGNGTSNFALPDLQGRVAVGMGQTPPGSLYDMGENGGVENVTLLYLSMPSHTHSLNALAADGGTNNPAGAVLATAALGAPRDQDRGNIYATGAPATSLVQASIAQTGGGQPHNNVQPLLALRYCIALAGVFPSRG